MNIFIAAITLIAQFALAAAGVLVGASVLLAIAHGITNAVRRVRGMAPMPLDDFMRRCGMEPAPQGWPFKRPQP